MFRPFFMIGLLLAANFCGCGHVVLANEVTATRSEDEWRIVLKRLVPDSVAAADLVPELIALLSDKKTSPVLRQQVALLIGRIGEPARKGVPVLIKIAQTSDRERRHWALKAIGHYRRIAKEAVPHFSAQLQDADHEIHDRQLIADVFGQIGTAKSIQLLAQTLLQENRQNKEKRIEHVGLRKAIVDALGGSGPVAIGALPALVRCLEDDDSDVRRKTCDAIARLGPQADTTVDSLAERLVVDDSPAVQDAAAFALTKMGSFAIPILERLLTSRFEELQWRAAKSLGQMPTLAKNSLTKLKTARKSGLNIVRIQAIEAVWRIDNDSESAARLLIDELSTVDRQHQAHAVRLLVEIKTLSASTETKLKMLSESTSTANRAARQVIKKRLLAREK
jgi:HEAT repeat protein